MFFTPIYVMQPQYILNPGIPIIHLDSQRRKFTESEDQRLRHIVDAVHKGVGNTQKVDWTTVSHLMGTRTARQCRERYINYLTPGLKNGAWSEDEENLLSEMYEKYGPKWSYITTFFPTRSDVNIKNHWTSMNNRRAKEERALRQHQNFTPASPVAAVPLIPGIAERIQSPRERDNPDDDFDVGSPLFDW